MVRGDDVKMGWVRPHDGTIKLNKNVVIGGNKIGLVCVWG